MAPNKKRICLALQGGGAYGAYTWGILDKLLEDERLEIDAVSATSAGSVNGVVMVYGLSKGGNACAREKLYDFWKTLSDYCSYFNIYHQNIFHMDFLAEMSFTFFDMLTRTLSPYVLNPANYNLLHLLLAEKIDFKELNEMNKIKLFLCATNVKKGKLKVFQNKEITIETVMASACLPHLYQSVEIDNEHYWDGGFVGNPAIFPLIYNSDIDDIIIVHTNPIFRDTVPISSTEIANRTNEISFNSSLLRELRAISFITDLLDKGWIKDEYKDKIRKKLMHIIRSDNVMSKFSIVNKYNWDWKFISHLRDLGRMTAELWLAENFESLGKKSTIDFNEFV